MQQPPSDRMHAQVWIPHKSVSDAAATRTACMLKSGSRAAHTAGVGQANNGVESHAHEVRCNRQAPKSEHEIRRVRHIIWLLNECGWSTTVPCSSEPDGGCGTPPESACAAHPGG